MDNVKSHNSSTVLQNALVGFATIRLQKMMAFFEASDTHMPAQMQVMFASLHNYHMQKLLVLMSVSQNNPMYRHAASTQAHLIHI
jgi:hypothetical protein